MKNIIITFLTMIFMSTTANASDLHKQINKVISQSKIRKEAISISIKSVDSKKEYSLNEKKSIMPASTQKLLTFFASMETLGEDYNFSTKLYKSNAGNCYYLVLGADPYLTAKDLITLTNKIKLPPNSEIKEFYIDDSIMDKQEWGEGWQWDDALNPLMPKFGSYNIDKNLFKIIATPTKIELPAKIQTEIFYPISFINNTVTTENEDNLSFSTRNYISPDVITVSGPVSKRATAQIPINHLKRYFLLRLDDALKYNNLEFYGKYKFAKLPQNVQLIEEIKHPIKTAEYDILKNSDNMVAETVFKLAGGKYKNTQATTYSAIEMFNDFCLKNNINIEEIRITDGSGVSKNNIVTADFMTNYILTLYKTDSQKYTNILAKPGEGTLKTRMLYLENNLNAKTGTLSNISSIVGIIKSKKGNDYAFCITINDANAKALDMKMLEEYIIRTVYNYL